LEFDPQLHGKYDGSALVLVTVLQYDGLSVPSQIPDHLFFWTRFEKKTTVRKSATLASLRVGYQFKSSGICPTKRTQEIYVASNLAWTVRSWLKEVRTTMLSAIPQHCKPAATVPNLFL